MSDDKDCSSCRDCLGNEIVFTEITPKLVRVEITGYHPFEMADCEISFICKRCKGNLCAFISRFQEK